MTDKKSASKTFVRDLMTVGVQKCKPDTPVRDIARFIIEKDVEAMVVLDHEGHAVGYVSRKELVKAYGSDKIDSLTAEDIMDAEIPTVPPDIPLIAAANLMADMNVRVFYMMHNAGGIIYPAAQITYKHFLRHIAMLEDEEIKDLGIRAERKAPLDAFIERRDQFRKQQQNKDNELG